MKRHLPRTQLRCRPSSAAGMAVLGALIVVMVATVLVTGLLQRQAADVRAMESLYASRQAHWLLLGGLDWARLVLASDGRNHATTNGGQLWAVPVADTRISQSDSGRVAVFSGHIEDEQAKFNLANIVRQGQLQPLPLQAFARLLELLGQPAGLAPLIAERLALGQATPGANGQAGRPAHTPALQSLDDLMLLDSITPQAVEILRHFATILPEATAVNVNTATAEVLAAVVPGLELGQARSVVAERDRGVWFNDKADFINRLANPTMQPEQAPIDVNSNWFLVKGAVTLDNSVLAVQALLKRPPRGHPEVIWTRELY